MKSYHFFIAVIAMQLVSCSKDSDFFPSYADDFNWESSLEEIMSDNKDIFEFNDIEITDVKLMKDLKLDSAIFFDSKYGFFPVYSKEDSVLEVIRYEEIDRRNEEYGYNEETVNKRIQKLIEHANDYDVIQLSWRYGTDTFKSLALFNKRTGELEYDNMLFNMATIAKYDAEKFILIMRSSETPPSDFSGSKTVRYYENGNVVASASLNWNVWGSWVGNTVLSYEDEDYFYYTTFYTYSYNSGQINTSSTNENNNYGIFIDYRNNSVTYQPRYEIEYALWAGPKNGFDDTNFTLHYMGNTAMQNRVYSGEGIYELVQDSPTRNPVQFKIEKTE